MHNEAIEIDEHFVLNTFDVNLIYLIILQSAPPTPQPVDAAGDSQDAGKLYKKMSYYVFSWKIVRLI